MCGEHTASSLYMSRFEGSSPRVRGTRERTAAPGTQSGIIPACAGNTDEPPALSFIHRDHPRVCGEHRGTADGQEEVPGSSPRVRGTLKGNAVARLENGIIPACAGNTDVSTHSQSSYRDHPRVCGEHESHPHPHHRDRGSSPRVRGTPRRVAYLAPPRGIIPACAGNTCSPSATTR